MRVDSAFSPLPPSPFPSLSSPLFPFPAILIQTRLGKTMVTLYHVIHSLQLQCSIKHTYILLNQCSCLLETEKDVHRECLPLSLRYGSLKRLLSSIPSREDQAGKSVKKAGEFPVTDLLCLPPANSNFNVISVFFFS